MSTLLYVLCEGAPKRPSLWGSECSDSKNPIGRTFSVRVDSDLSGSCIFAETGKSRLSVKPRSAGGASLEAETSIHKEELSGDKICII